MKFYLAEMGTDINLLAILGLFALGALMYLAAEAIIEKNPEWAFQNLLMSLLILVAIFVFTPAGKTILEIFG